MPSGTITSAIKENEPPIDIGCLSINRANGSGHTILLPYRFTDSVVPYPPTVPNTNTADNEFFAIRIETLPVDDTGGHLELNYVPLVVGDIVLFSQMANIQNGFVYNTPHQGVDAISFSFTYSVSNVGDPNTFVTTTPATGQCAVTGTGSITTEGYINLPPDVIGNSFLFTLNRTTLIHTVANFISGTAPPYNDPEGDAADAIMVTHLPINGELRLNGVLVSANDIIDIVDIGNSLFTFIPPDQDAQDVDDWGFIVRDVGSMTFSEEFGIITITSLVADDNFTLIDVGFNVGVNTSCFIGSGTSIYIPFGDSFSTATVIWLNSDGTGVPPAGYYSQGGIVRLWDGVNLFGAIASCLPIYEIILGYSAVSGVLACGNFTTTPVTYYAKDPDFLITDNLWSVLDPLTNAIAGFYSNGVNYREMDALGNFIGITGVCP